MKRRRQAFLLDQATCLDETPFAIRRKFALPKWKFIQRNARADDVDLIFVATELDHRALQRRRSDEDSGDGVQHLLRRLPIRGLLHIDQHIGAVKRNDAWFRPCPDQGQEMDGNVSEENVQKLGVPAIQNLNQATQFCR